MTHPSSSPTCPECGTRLPDDSPQEICPACLLRQALASRTITGSAPKPASTPLSPEEIADKFPQFEIVECLGRGGMGVVYKARQKTLDRLVAIKVLAGERRDDPQFEARFTREARTLAKMSHPNIVTVFDHGETDGLFYIVMEYVDGVNLRHLLRDGKMAPEQALAIVPPICEALEYAHDKGVVHRDIKPENLLLDRDGRVKIADFGIASLVGASGEKSGTPPYMAPEQELGVVDRRADIYALGAVLYEMLTGERPTKDLVAPSKRVEIDVRLDEIVLRALEKEPARRYQTAGEFRTVVQTMTSQSGATARAGVKGSKANVGSDRQDGTSSSPLERLVDLEELADSKRNQTVGSPPKPAAAYHSTGIGWKVLRVFSSGSSEAESRRGRKPPMNVIKHIRILSIAYQVLGALLFIGALILPIVVAISFSGNIGTVPLLVGVGLGVYFIFVGYALRERHHYSLCRVAAIVLLVLSILTFPPLAALGIYTLIVLKKEPVIDMFTRDKQDRDLDEPANSNSNEAVGTSPPESQATPGPFRRLWWLFLVSPPVCLLLGIAVGTVWSVLTPKQYEAHTVIEIRHQATGSGETGVIALSSGDPAWISRLNAVPILDRVTSRLDLARAWSVDEAQARHALVDLATFPAIPNTNLRELRIMHNDAPQAAAIANAWTQAFKEWCTEQNTDESIVIHQEATTPQRPVAPNVQRIIFMSAAIGLLLSPLVAILLIQTIHRGGRWLVRVVAISLGIIAALVLIVFSAVSLLRKLAVNDASIDAPRPPVALAPAETTPEHAARSFMEAIRDGDIDAAMKWMDRSTDTWFAPDFQPEKKTGDRLRDSLQHLSDELKEEAYAGELDRLTRFSEWVPEKRDETTRFLAVGIVAPSKWREGAPEHALYLILSSTPDGWRVAHVGQADDDKSLAESMEQYLAMRARAVPVKSPPATKDGSSASPEQAARSFMEAIRDGDMDAALKWMTNTIPRADEFPPGEDDMEWLRESLQDLSDKIREEAYAGELEKLTRFVQWLPELQDTKPRYIATRVAAPSDPDEQGMKNGIYLVLVYKPEGWRVLSFIVGINKSFEDSVTEFLQQRVLDFPVTPPLAMQENSPVTIGQVKTALKRVPWGTFLKVLSDRQGETVTKKEVSPDGWNGRRYEVAFQLGSEKMLLDLLVDPAFQNVKSARLRRAAEPSEGVEDASEFLPVLAYHYTIRMAKYSARQNPDPGLRQLVDIQTMENYCTALDAYGRRHASLPPGTDTLLSADYFPQERGKDAATIGLIRNHKTGAMERPLYHGNKDLRWRDLDPSKFIILAAPSADRSGNRLVVCPQRPVRLISETDYQQQIAEQAKTDSAEQAKGATPEQAARSFMEAIRDGDMDNAMAWVSPELKQKEKFSLHLELASKILRDEIYAGQLERLTQFTETEFTNVDGTTMLFAARITPPAGDQAPRRNHGAVLILSSTPDGWKVEEFSDGGTAKSLSEHMKEFLERRVLVIPVSPPITMPKDSPLTAAQAKELLQGVTWGDLLTAIFIDGRGRGISVRQLTGGGGRTAV